MYRKERVDIILKVLHQNGFANVKMLCDEVGYSKATVNREIPAPPALQTFLPVFLMQGDLVFQAFLGS